MAKSRTIEEVAQESGVGTATVDRVLAGHAKMRQETIRKVAEAMHRIGYSAPKQIGQFLGLPAPEMTFGFVLHKREHPFYKNFAKHIEEAVSARFDIRFSADHTAGGFLREFQALDQQVDALACTAISHQSITQGVESLKGRGILTFAAINDFAQGVREANIGLNNMQAGKISGWALTKSASATGKLAVMIGGNRWHNQELRETGFRSYLQNRAPQFQVLETVVNPEQRQLTYDATLELLQSHSDLRGIFVAGGGMEGAIAALRQARPREEIALVVNELTEDSRAGLVDGFVTMVVSTPLRTLCHSLIDMMITATESGPNSTPRQQFFMPDIYIPEML